MISGKSPTRIASTAGMLADWLTEAGAEVRPGQVAHTLNHHRGGHRLVRHGLRPGSRRRRWPGWRRWRRVSPAPGVVGPHAGPCRAGTVFVYSGQGSQWAGMGRQLLADEPAFAAAVDELDPAFVEQVGFSLRAALESGEPVTGIDRIQPVLVGLQLALTALWRSYGVHPDAVIGHSMGEVTAAVVAGALSPADGLKVIATRSRLMARLSGQGAMALLEVSGDEAEELLADYPDVSVAVEASPQQIVIAGPPDQVDARDRGRGGTGPPGPARRRRRRLPSLDHRSGAGGSACRTRRSEPPAPGDPGVRHHRRPADRRHRGLRRGLLGGKPAQPGPVHPGRGSRRRRARHLHRDQPEPGADLRDRRHPRPTRTITPSPP